MTPPFDRPPRVAAWLVNLFASADESEPILGDLLEEFSGLASTSGAALSRRWYWRQALKTAAKLLGSSFRAAPWSIAAAVVAGFVLRKLIARIPEWAIFAFVDRYQVFDRHFEIYRFLASTGIDIAHLITFVFVGAVAALIGRRREMSAPIVLAFIFAAMAVVGSVVAVTRDGQFAYLWRLGWYFSDSLAILAGAATVRMLRTRAAGRSLAA